MKQPILGPIQPAPILVATIAVIVLAVTLTLPKPASDPEVQRPAHPTVVAAIHQGAAQAVTGRIINLKPSGMVLRLLLGIRKVATLRHTTYAGSTGAPLAPGQLHRGDSVRVSGYLVDKTLLAVSVRDLSRR